MFCNTTGARLFWEPVRTLLFLQLWFQESISIKTFWKKFQFFLRKTSMSYHCSSSLTKIFSSVKLLRLKLDNSIRNTRYEDKTFWKNVIIPFSFHWFSTLFELLQLSTLSRKVSPLWKKKVYFRQFCFFALNFKQCLEEVFKRFHFAVKNRNLVVFWPN